MLREHRLVSSVIVSCLLLLFSCGRDDSSDAESPMAVTTAPVSVLSEIAAWRAVGGKTELSELTLGLPAQGSRNAADLHQPLFDIMSSMSAHDQELISSPWDAPVSSLGYVRESYERELEAIRKAVSFSYCDWRTRFDRGIERELPYLIYARRAGRLLLIDAILRADAGDVEGAADTLQDILRLSDQVASDPIAICAIVRISFDRWVVDATRRLFKDNPDVASSLIETLSKRDYREEIRRALLGEGAVVLIEYRRRAGHNLASPIEHQTMPAGLAAELVWYLRVNRGFVEQARRPYFEMSSLANAPSRPGAPIVPEDCTEPVLLDHMCTWSASAENLLAQARLAVQLERHRVDHGEYPDPNTVKLPVDMLTGKPMVYIRYSDGFVLRVIGSSYGGEISDVEWEW